MNDATLATVFRLADGIAIRAERFGGLVYRYDNRRLYFLRSHEVTDFVRGLDGRQPLGAAVADFLASRGLPQSTGETMLNTAAQLARLGILVPIAVRDSPALTRS